MCFFVVVVVGHFPRENSTTSSLMRVERINSRCYLTFSCQTISVCHILIIIFILFSFTPSCTVVLYFDPARRCCPPSSFFFSSLLCRRRRLGSICCPVGNRRMVREKEGMKEEEEEKNLPFSSHSNSHERRALRVDFV